MLAQSTRTEGNAPKRKSSEDRRAEIVRVALDLSFTLGPDNVTTSTIAHTLGLSQPAIYKHFPKKAEIWLAISETLGERIKRNIHLSKTKGGSGKDQLRYLLVQHLALMRDVPALPDIMLMHAPDGAKTRLQSHLLASMVTYRAALTEAVQAAIKSRQFHQDINPEDATALIIGIAQSLALRMLVSRNSDNLVENGERLLALLLAGFTEKGEC